MKTNILELRGLKKYFSTPFGLLHAVDGISLNIEQGKTLGLVGESGCGKSTCGKTILRLQEPTGGKIYYDGIDIRNLNPNELRVIRRDMQIIFQDPYASLNPRKSITQIIEAPLLIHKVFKDKAAREKRVKELMELVGLAERLTNAYPHELDGGRRQRAVIARALALEPKFLVCDEPVSALDVSIQAQILNLLQDLQDNMGLTYMFITHDLSVVKHISDKIAVMYLGKIIELADKDKLFQNPAHPYTQALLSAIPRPILNQKRKRIVLKGEISSPINPPSGCRFSKRCPYRRDECDINTPELRQIETGHEVACHYAGEL